MGSRSESMLSRTKRVDPLQGLWKYEGALASTTGTCFSDQHYANTSAGKHFEKLQGRLENQEAEREAEREEHRCQIQEMKLAMQSLFNASNQSEHLNLQMVAEYIAIVEQVRV
ncbi:unnamed protein product [Miscanthus lutarioriparius]|uniref:Uncharacterized protein n=1 Tax=Miscanthus lutarioriparius TaxID=422564 RepID=A0A811RZK1_9POAL|nr:unnamed protein product [Miscanthus lutarioriparius]